MSAINMFHALWLGLDSLTIVMVGKQHHWALDIGWQRKKTTLGPKHNVSGPSTINTSLDNHIGEHMVCKTLTIIKD